MLRFLRIAVTAFAAVAICLLTAMWIRSYKTAHEALGPLWKDRSLAIASKQGRVMVVLLSHRFGAPRAWFTNSGRGNEPSTSPLSIRNYERFMGFGTVESTKEYAAV